MKIVPWFIVIALLCAVFVAVDQYAYDQGYAAAVDEYQKADLQSLNGVIDEFKTLAKDAKTQSLQLSKTISARQVADQNSTQVFVNALNTTAHLRFDCRFDDNIMQQIYQAADSADQAAASGFGITLPTRTAPDG